jgi:tetratricopeptide (TPR) repeat protein
LANIPGTSPQVFIGLWLGSGVAFGVLMLFALRTAMGAKMGTAVVVVSLAWLAMCLGVNVFTYVSPLMFSPFLLFYALMYFGGTLGGEVRGFGNAFRQKQNFKRFLQNATVNPKDADAHLQLGLIYLERRQEAKAIEHFEKALAIDPNEVDANFEMGRIAREKGHLQTALNHFATVLGHDDRYRLSEIWREIGATYLEANMLDEAKDALEKFVDRRAADPEGLYYLGRVLKAKGDESRAREVLAEAVEAAQTSPDFRKRKQKQWSRLAEKELAGFIS